MLIAAMITGGIALAIGLFFLILHPFICIFDCVISKKHSGGSKALWIVLSLAFGCLASLVYSIFITESRKLRSLSIQGLTFGILAMAAAVGISASSPEVTEKLASFQTEAVNFTESQTEGASETEALDGMLKKLEEFSSEAEELAQSMEEAGILTNAANANLSDAFEQLKDGNLEQAEELAEQGFDSIADDLANDKEKLEALEQFANNGSESAEALKAVLENDSDVDWNDMVEASGEWSAVDSDVDAEWNSEEEIGNLAAEVMKDVEGLEADFDSVLGNAIASDLESALGDDLEDALSGDVAADFSGDGDFDDAIGEGALDESTRSDGSLGGADLSSDLAPEQSGASVISSLNPLFSGGSQAGNPQASEKPQSTSKSPRTDPQDQLQNDARPTPRKQKPVATTAPSPRRTDPKPINRYLENYYDTGTAATAPAYGTPQVKNRYVPQ